MHTTPITARLVQRSEGLVFRYDWTHANGDGRGESQPNTYAFLRDDLGYTKAQALAIIALAEADAQTIVIDGERLPWRMAEGNLSAVAAVIVNGTAVLFGTVQRAADSAAQINAYEPIFARATGEADFTYAGVAGDILAD